MSQNPHCSRCYFVFTGWTDKPKMVNNRPYCAKCAQLIKTENVIVTAYDNRNIYNLTQLEPKGEWHVFIEDEHNTLCSKIPPTDTVTYQLAGEYPKRKRKVCYDCYKIAHKGYKPDRLKLELAK